MNAPHQNAVKLPPITLSVVIPLYNESEMLALLHARLRTALEPLNLHYELVLVDDGSRDATASMLRALATNDPKVRAAYLGGSA